MKNGQLLFHYLMHNLCFTILWPSEIYLDCRSVRIIRLTVSQKAIKGNKVSALSVVFSVIKVSTSPTVELASHLFQCISFATIECWIRKILSSINTKPSFDPLDRPQSRLVVNTIFTQVISQSVTKLQI